MKKKLIVANIDFLLPYLPSQIVVINVRYCEKATKSKFFSIFMKLLGNVEHSGRFFQK